MTLAQANPRIQSTILPGGPNGMSESHCIVSLVTTRGFYLSAIKTDTPPSKLVSPV